MTYLLLIVGLFILWRWWDNIGSYHRQPGKRRSTKLTTMSFRLTAPKPAWVKNEVIRLKALMPDAGCRKVAAIFNRRFENQRNITIGKTYASTVICKHLYEIQVLRHERVNTGGPGQ